MLQRARIRLSPILPLAVLLASAFIAFADRVADPRDHDTPEADTSPILIRDRAVRAELKLSDQQAKVIDPVCKEVNHTLLAMRSQPRQTAEEGTAQALTRLNETLKATLSAEQHNRFGEILLQLQGALALLQPEVAERLALSEVQQQALREIAREAAPKPKEKASTAAPSSDGPAMRPRERDRRLLAVLTAEQKSKWKTLLGKPFDFSDVQTIGVEAPEFEEAAAWINTEPLTMAGLRGQVVVVHFYAFGCGNCIANYPWYKGWQKTFGGKGVTIVGIHTPETKGESDIAAVRRKAEEAGFTFPILVDNAKRNWAAWSNNVWPAVYLVDKKGHVRSWWYGELNWKGAPGEQRMREQISQLLKEKAPESDSGSTARATPATQPVKAASSE